MIAAVLLYMHTALQNHFAVGNMEQDFYANLKKKERGNGEAFQARKCWTGFKYGGSGFPARSPPQISPRFITLKSGGRMLQQDVLRPHRELGHRRRLRAGRFERGTTHQRAGRAQRAHAAINSKVAVAHTL